jgi:hypothetical protein
MMNWLPTVDLFAFFRWMLAWIVTIYVTVVTLRFAWGWVVWLAGSDKYVSMLRRYLILQGLRLRFSTFFGDLVISVLLCIAFALLWRANVVLSEVDQMVTAARMVHGR